MNWIAQIFDPATIGGLITQFENEIQQPQFWVALTKIIWINVLLSGDNALVIALACRGLQPKQRVWGMILGAGVAVFLRIIFTFIVNFDFIFIFTFTFIFTFNFVNIKAI